MNIKDLLKPEQYNSLKKDYNVLVKNKNKVSFEDFCTKQYYLK